MHCCKTFFCLPLYQVKQTNKPNMKSIISLENNTFGGINYTTRHAGKMSGIFSLSTSVNINKHCLARRDNPNLICSKCFAVKYTKMRRNLEIRLQANTKLLNERILTNAEMPIIPTLYFRFESFGDLQSETQVINYFNIAKSNPNVHCALWTKNLVYIKGAIAKGYKVPKNLQIVFSSPILNKEIDITKLPNFVNKVFSVFDGNTIETKGIKINCGGKNCLACGLCYNPNKVTYIREKVK